MAEGYGLLPSVNKLFFNPFPVQNRDGGCPSVNHTNYLSIIFKI